MLTFSYLVPIYLEFNLNYSFELFLLFIFPPVNFQPWSLHSQQGCFTLPVKRQKLVTVLLCLTWLFMASSFTAWLHQNEHVSDTDLAKLESLYYIMVRERKVCNRVAQEQLNKQQWMSTNHAWCFQSCFSKMILCLIKCLCHVTKGTASKNCSKSRRSSR